MKRIRLADWRVHDHCLRLIFVFAQSILTDSIHRGGFQTLLKTMNASRLYETCRKDLTFENF